MARSVDNFSSFLSTVKQYPVRSSGAEAVPQQSAPSGSAAQLVLLKVLSCPDGIDLGLLYKETSLDFSVFAEAVERLKKLDGVRVIKGPSGEIAFPGPNSSEVESLIS